MNNVFKDLSFDEFIIPGQIYCLIEESCRETKLEPLSFFYTIRSGPEVVAALETLFGIVMAENYEARAFQGIKKCSTDCYKLNILCYEKCEGKEEDYLLYLHRIETFDEYRSSVQKLFE